MPPLRVVVPGALGKHPAEMSLPEDQHPIGEFGSDGQHEPFGEAVRPRTAGRDLDHLDARVRQHRIKRDRELTGPIADEEPEVGSALAEAHHEIAGLLGRPLPVGMSRHTQHMQVALPTSSANST
jgi:hypothetical protein